MLYSKEETEKKIIDHLYWDSRVDASDINVCIKDDTVQLTGTVPTQLGREAAESDVWAVPGITHVENLISVRSNGNVEVLNDTEIRDDLRNVLNWDPSLAGDNIVVSVDNGIAALEGWVDVYWKKTRAEELAFEVVGIVSVSNRLVVVPTHDILDEVVAQGIMDALSRNGEINVETIDIKVANGRVTLTGTVPERASYRAVFDIVRYTTGVREVKNELMITPPDL